MENLVVKLYKGMTTDQIRLVLEKNIVGPRSERDRAIIWSYLTGRFTYESLAEEYEVSVSTVQRAIERGRGLVYD